MVDFEKQFERPRYSLRQEKAQLALTFRLVYGWMCAGLALSGAVAWHVARSGTIERLLRSGSGMPVFMGCLIAEIALVMILGGAIRKLPAAAATAMFIVYAALNGFTLSVVFLAYELPLIGRAFFVTAGMFGGLALWGTFTKGDLSGIGSACGMALWGLIIAGIANIFLKSDGMDWCISFIGILVFTGLTMYDAQKIKQMAAAEGTLDRQTVRKLGILGALSLYLDFVNLFMHILRFFGRRK